MVEIWAKKWGIPEFMLKDLRKMYQSVGPSGPPNTTEAKAQQDIRLVAPEFSMTLWRNNVGAFVDDRGIPVRYGLSNDSRKMNRSLKSSDLIGISTISISDAMVGMTFGKFTSIEVKRPGWKYKGTPREAAQRRWIELVNSLGGSAYFATGKGDLK